MDLRTVELLDKALYSLKNYENYLKESFKNQEVENYIYDLFNHHYRDKDKRKPRYRFIFKLFYGLNIVISLLILLFYVLGPKA